MAPLPHPGVSDAAAAATAKVLRSSGYFAELRFFTLARGVVGKTVGKTHNQLPHEPNKVWYDIIIP